jgi:Arc/MetJ family transcription regulator
MRITVTLGDELVADAKSFTGIENYSALVREALKRLIHRQASRRLAKLGGTMPDIKPIPRRR